MSKPKMSDPPRVKQSTDWVLLRKIRDRYVPTTDYYARAFICELADRLERDNRLHAAFKRTVMQSIEKQAVQGGKA